MAEAAAGRSIECAPLLDLLEADSIKMRRRMRMAMRRRCSRIHLCASYMVRMRLANHLWQWRTASGKRYEAL